MSGLLAVQAENHSQASWAVATRTTGVDEAAFARQFDTGAILRTHVLRSTWHYVRPEDIGWLLELTGPRVRRLFRSHQRALGLDDSILDVAATRIIEALAGGNHLTRDSLRERLLADGLPAAGEATMVMAAHAELTGLICSGAMQDGRHTYALLAERAPKSRRLGRDEALAELALRYFTGHGPATERDLAYWATLTLTDVRSGLAAVADQLHSFEHDGRIFWSGAPAPAEAPHPRAHLLQILDEYYRGYQDSRWVLDVDGLAGRDREALAGMVLIDGQFAGDMRRTIAGDRVRFEIGLRRSLGDDERVALDDAARRYATFLGREHQVDAIGGLAHTPTSLILAPH
ncbi:MAG: winged helix DNA-binding domain-containing protein [Acidimicrobiales bacterium]